MGMAPAQKAKKGRFGAAKLAPVVTITSALVTGADLDAAGTAIDETGDLSATITWSSDVDGALGTGAALTAVTLSVGTHVIEASATDGTKIGTDTVTVEAV